MQKIIVITTIVIAAAAAGFVFQQRQATSEPASAMIEIAGAEQQIVAIDNYAAQIAQWDGEARLINFWATWCAPCRREIPLLKELQASKDAKQLQVIGVAVDYMEEVVAYAEQAQFNYPILVGQEAAMEAAETSGVEFIGLPFSLLLSPSGELISTHIGEIKDEHIERMTDVMQALANGEIDLAEARSELHSL